MVRVEDIKMRELMQDAVLVVLTIEDKHGGRVRFAEELPDQGLQVLRFAATARRAHQTMLCINFARDAKWHRLLRKGEEWRSGEIRVDLLFVCQPGFVRCDNLVRRRGRLLECQM